MDNAVARMNCNAEKLQASGEVMGDPFEISRIRREDFQTHRGRAEGDDVLQALNKASSKCPRGHQGPAAFLIRASGLDKVSYFLFFLLCIIFIFIFYTSHYFFHHCCLITVRHYYFSCYIVIYHKLIFFIYLHYNLYYYCL